jgi:hypothetical protein
MMRLHRKQARGKPAATGASRRNAAAGRSANMNEDEDVEEQAELQQEVIRLEEQPKYIKGSGRMRGYQVSTKHRLPNTV